MTSSNLLFAFLMLLLPHSLFSQGFNTNSSVILSSNRDSDLKFLASSFDKDISFDHRHQFSGIFADTLTSKLFDEGSVQNKVVHPQWIKGAIVPAAMIMAGTITLLPASHCLLSKYAIQKKLLIRFPAVDTPIDNYLQYVPIVAVFGLKAAGVRSRSDFVNQLAIVAKAEFLMGVIVHGMKKTIRDERPSGIGMNTMPSGHTAQAFVAATILDMEYRDSSPWISIGGYAVATTTAIGRMVNNKHWISDVLIGAGIGVFSAKVVYYTHQYRLGKKKNMVILPTLYKNGGGISFAMVL